MNKVEALVERWIFRSRWLLAPFFVGLLLAIVALLVKFLAALGTLLLEMFSSSSDHMVVSILTLVDEALIAALLLIIAFSGYENFVSKTSSGDHEDRPSWMDKTGFSDLKIKLMGALVAISAVAVLKAFIHPETFTREQLAWRVGIHLTFVISGVLLAISDRITGSKGDRH
jgi:uncharacterized protein (TIGR00645 family)